MSITYLKKLMNQDNELLPVVSVIVPLYNKEKYLSRSLASVFSQTFCDFELIVVDDGSTDNSFKILSTFTDKRLRIIQQINLGPGSARNKGVSLARADLVAFLDADDEWSPTFLEESIEKLTNHPECDISIFGQLRGKKGESLETHLRKNGIEEGVWSMPIYMANSRLKPTLDFFHSGSIVCKKKIILDFGGFYSKSKCTYGEDIYLWIQVAFNCKVYRCPTPMMWYHTEASELSVYNRKILPPWPMLYDPNSIRKNCSFLHRFLLEKYLAYYAILASNRSLASQNWNEANKILNKFILCVVFDPKSYIVLRLKILLLWVNYHQKSLNFPSDI